MNTSEQATASSEGHTTQQASSSDNSEGDSVTAAGVKRSSSDENSNADSGSKMKRPYDGGICCTIVFMQTGNSTACDNYIQEL